MIMRSNKQITTPIGRYAGCPILSAFFAEGVGFNSPSSARFGQ